MREILEIIYFLSGPTIAVIAIIGLKQITVAKENSVLSAKRESLKLAAEQCKYYYERIIPLQNELDIAIKENNVIFFEKSKVEVFADSFKVLPYAEDKKGALVVAPQITAVLNMMESFATYFVSRVADEKVAFTSIGATFCGETKMLLPIIALASSGKHYNNLIKLFLLWNSRQEKHDLLRDKQKLEERINSISNKVIKPLGTEE